MSRAILCIGIPRSGTSCVSGVLHKLGINMGAGHFQSKDRFNQRGYFEDLRWRMLTQKVTGTGYSLKAAGLSSVPKGLRQRYRKLARECSKCALWGVKDPWFCFVPGRVAIKQIRAVDTEVRMIIVRRDPEACQQSVARHLRKSYGNRYGKAANIIQTWSNAMEARIAEFDGATMEIRYGHLIASPDIYVRALWAFASWGLDIKMPSNIDQVAEWVTPTLKHF